MAFDLPVHGPFPRGQAPVIVGHRGAGRGVSPGGHRENTVASFLEAVAAGATWVELDVQATADGVLLLRHDVGTGPALTGTALADLGDHAWETLADVHAALPPWVGIDVDLKVGLPDPSGTDITVAASLAWLVEHAAERPWVLTSFDPTVVLLARSAGLAAGWLTTGDWHLHEALATAARLGSSVVAVHAGTITSPMPDCPDVAAVMATAVGLGVQVLAWGALPGDVPALRAAGVTAICVDDVAGCVHALRDDLAA